MDLLLLENDMEGQTEIFMTIMTISSKRIKNRPKTMTIKNGIMNLTNFMFYLSVSVYLFLSSQISYKFPDRAGADFYVLTKTMISWEMRLCNFWFTIKFRWKVEAYWLKLLHYCFMIGYHLSLHKICLARRKSFPSIHSRFTIQFVRNGLLLILQ